METNAHLILRTLEKHLTASAQVRLFGGAALILGYGLTRFTEDADVLVDDAELRALMEDSGFEEAVAQTNAELAPKKLYISHLFGPEQEILTTRWRESCRSVPEFDGRLRLSVLSPLDLIVSKLGRGDEQDLDDIEYLMRHERLGPEEIRAAVREAMVPEILAEVFEEATARLERRLTTFTR